nr:hypothetical protein CFP56_46821 [Quercus suber]
MYISPPGFLSLRHHPCTVSPRHPTGDQPCQRHLALGPGRIRLEPPIDPPSPSDIRHAMPVLLQHTCFSAVDTACTATSGVGVPAGMQRTACSVHAPGSHSQYQRKPPDSAAISGSGAL